jgi:hypothetical protein
MSHETKDQAAPRECIHRTGWLKWLLWLPVAGVILCSVWLLRLFHTPKTAAELRSADKEHQSHIRRKLRGLPAVHGSGQAGRVT